MDRVGSAFPLRVSAPVLKMMSPIGESSSAVVGSSTNQTGATWGRPSARTVASLPVCGGALVSRFTSAVVAHGVVGHRDSDRLAGSEDGGRLAGCITFR